MIVRAISFVMGLALIDWEPKSPCTWGVVLSLMFEGRLSFLLWREDDD